MNEAGEVGLLSLVISNLAAAFRWKLDSSHSAPLGILIGGSNTFRLQKAFEDMSKPVEALVASSWAISMGLVDSLVPNLAAILVKSAADIPVVFWCLDNSCFRSLTPDGDLVSINKLADKKFHVVGELAVAPFSLLNSVLRELKHAIDACGSRLVLVMEVLPRFLLRPCCNDLTHCSNTRQLDSAGVAASKRVLHDLADLNIKIADYLSASNMQYVSTGDLLAGCDNATMGELMDLLFSFLSKDPVHRDKVAYTRIAMGVINILSRKLNEGDLRNSLNSKKRGRDDTLPPRDASHAVAGALTI
jgi:hypothetical protein